MITITKTIKALSQVINPSSTKNIVEEGIVKNITVDENCVSFELFFQTQSASIKHEIQIKAEMAVKNMDGVEKVISHVVNPENNQTTVPPHVQTPLNKVKNIIAISSAKGGVGKSTLAAHFAQNLVHQGYNVGLMDADIYGPSIPTLFYLKNVKILTNEKNQLLPIEHNKLKLMSFGFLLGDNPAVMRGPIVTRYIQQLLLNTDWGALDYLLIDMPPGTGDVQLTITQSIRLTGAVIITTPHNLSLIDVAKGIIMFEKVEVPIVGIVENMSFLKTKEGEKHYIFGQSTSEQLANRFGVKILAEIPILEELSRGIQSTEEPRIICEAVNAMLERVEYVKSNTGDIPAIKFDPIHVEFQWSTGEKWLVKNFDLRMISQDALSVNEMTGERILKAEDIRDDIAAKEVSPLGNYGVSVVWNDGHSSAIYTYKNIRQIAVISS